MSEHQRKQMVAAMMGYIAGLHRTAKTLEAEGVSEMDMVCCALEDIDGMLAPLIQDVTDAEAIALNAT